jgi:hypothetical protein
MSEPRMRKLRDPVMFSPEREVVKVVPRRVVARKRVVMPHHRPEAVPAPEGEPVPIPEDNEWKTRLREREAVFSSILRGADASSSDAHVIEEEHREEQEAQHPDAESNLARDA